MPRGDEAVASHLGDLAKGTLDPVEDVAHHAGAEFHGERLTRADHGIAHGEAGGFLVTPDRGRLALESDDLTDQLVAAHAHQLVHRRAVHLVRDHDGSGHLRRRAREGSVSVGFRTDGDAGSWAKGAGGGRDPILGLRRGSGSGNRRARTFLTVP